MRTEEGTKNKSSSTKKIKKDSETKDEDTDKTTQQRK